MLRFRIVISVILAFGAILGGTVAAQDAASPSLLAEGGYPEAVIEVNDDGVRAPGAVMAGRTLITYKNSGAESRHAFLARLPDNIMIADIFAEPGEDAPPSWLLNSTFPGFPGEVQPGEQQQAVVDLTPGMYLVAEDFVAIFLVFPAGDSGASPVPVAAPQADATISMFDFDFAFPDTLQAGQQVWEVVNVGQQPHELLLIKIPDGTTDEELVACITENPSCTLAEDDLVAGGGVGWLSPGGSAWTEVDLAVGQYAAVCFVFDPATGMPHAMMGMVESFTVS